MKRERRRARGIALQVLYEVDTVGHPAAEVIARHLEHNPALSENAVQFVRRLVLGTHKTSAQIDQWIAECAPEWPVDELAVLDRNILRIALWEFIVADETPLKIAINEAVELAKRFGSESAPRFINGVLGTLAEREQELRRRVQAASHSP
jgi:N utilization substance protein B